MKKSILVTLLAFSVAGQPAARGELPATGQAFCRDTDLTIPPEPSCDNTECPGQDGDFQAGCPIEGRFVILPGPNGVVDPAEDPEEPGVPIPAIDDTIFDRCTGLEWQRSTADTTGDGAFMTTDTNGDQVFEPDDGLQWSAALTYCEDLVYAGESDWRLPNILELQSIVDYGGAGSTTAGQTLIDDAFILGTYRVHANSEAVHWASTCRPACSTSPVGTRCYSALPVDSLSATGVGFNGPSAGGMGLGAVTTVRFIRAVRGGTINAAAGGGAVGSEEHEGQGAGPDCAGTNGDTNGDGGTDLSDAVYLLAWLFQGGSVPLQFCIPAGPKEADCAVDNGDTNADGSSDLSDAIFLLAFLFQGGSEIAPKCEGGTETICNDNVDDDLDGDTDCADTDCDADPVCLAVPEVCDNATDDDLDGDTDCADADCVLLAICDIATDLPSTGVTACYDDQTGAVIPCAGTGQDAEYQAGCAISPRFELDTGPDGVDDNVDSTTIDDTVTDMCTGLEWQRWRNQEGPPGGAWCDVVEYCKVDLNTGGGFAGKTGWRCANIREAGSLLQYGLPAPPSELETLVDPLFGKRPGIVSGACSSTLYDGKGFYCVNYSSGIGGEPLALTASVSVFAVRDADTP
jgi:hypothetical protein